MQGPAGETKEGKLAPRFSSRRIPNLDGGGVGISVAGAKISRASGGAYAPLPFRSKVFRRAGISLKTQYLGINKPPYLFAPLNITSPRVNGTRRTGQSEVYSRWCNPEERKNERKKERKLTKIVI